MYIHAFAPGEAFTVPLCGRTDFHTNELLGVDEFKFFADKMNGLCWECAAIIGIKRLEDA